eukprot:14072761-Alexandrium_andersonii.AAC.1
MSASLVGSEMCIRDRRRARLSPRRTFQYRFRVRVASRRRPCSRAPQACLLYTSDAATICSV